MANMDTRDERSEPAEGGLPVDDAQGRPRRRDGTWWQIAAIAGSGLVAGGLIAFVLGFVHFANSIAAMEKPEIKRPADAIIALTGGTSRIDDALNLLSAGKAKRLLITGVHPETDSKALADLSPQNAQLFECCIDLGYAAQNTLGNAKEAREWARGKNWRTFIVVTSNYHLPRSMKEIGRAMPGTRLIGYPVSSERVMLPEWWRSTATTRLLLGEFTKYLMAATRLRVGTPLAGPKSASTGHD